MKLDKKTEAKALVYLENGKKGWDVPHTLTAVHYMRKLIEKEGGDEKILVSAMYLHDIGYPKSKKGYTFEDTMHVKSLHAEIGAKESEKILKELGGYSPEDIRQITHLVRVHDEVEKLLTKNEILVMEADSLAQIDYDKITPNFNKENLLKFFDYFKESRMPRFKTKTGKKLLKKLFKKANEYVVRMK